ncbi:FecCD family ABC transporter permease [Archaeoglobus profundus]|uniref:Transport system permease protein n=1 Tax=Archaeoglobus profundus (strain DSM 5631 / JCM 9629 / NBRC 100127 / Av18) TaxID=572546 RepID=D2RD80_ARCPA|nr:iron ABC transporter permease [Archaeoglobus profundus]ADB58074.1 transport system permease protein [Archaeoglobus profundus DSM 5631]
MMEVSLADYRNFIRKRTIFVISLLFLLILASIYSLLVGSSRLDCKTVIDALMGTGTEKAETIIWNIRLPRVLMAVSAGAGLALSGLITQTVLRNPLASPFTLGISSAAAFGAALAIVSGVGGIMLETALGGFQITNFYVVIISAFAFSLIATFAILTISKMKGASPAVIVLAGLAILFLFSAATSLIQYFGTTEQVAAIVFWLFGSLSKTTWVSLEVMSLVLFITLFISYRWCWKFNALYLGDDIAKSLGVDARRMRLVGMVIASLLTATAVSFLGVISFVCLVSPHIARLALGSDHRYLIPSSCLIGAIILLVADTASRTLFLPLTLPVGIFTSFLGVPLFIYLIIKRGERAWW